MSFDKEPSELSPGLKRAIEVVEDYLIFLGRMEPLEEGYHLYLEDDFNEGFSDLFNEIKKNH